MTASHDHQHSLATPTLMRAHCLLRRVSIEAVVNVIGNRVCACAKTAGLSDVVAKSINKSILGTPLGCSGYPRKHKESGFYITCTLCGSNTSLI